jgi:hypothetical protein
LADVLLGDQIIKALKHLICELRLAKTQVSLTTFDDLKVKVPDLNEVGGRHCITQIKTIRADFFNIDKLAQQGAIVIRKVKELAEGPGQIQMALHQFRCLGQQRIQ